MNCTVTTAGGGNALVQGWVSQPNYRGTFDIAISCLITIVLCAWSSICVNIPSPDYGNWDIFWDKWHLFCLGLLGPEFIFALALGQYRSALASVKAFAGFGKEKHTKWTMKHAFFAEMGGFVLQPAGWDRFPLTTRQLYYLVSKGYIAYPEISKRQIDDRDKSDGLSRFLALSQMVWFTISVIARAGQDLAITTAEITTLGFSYCTLGIAFCWRHKPMDVHCPIVLETKYTIQEILLEADNPLAAEPYRKTPLDFVDREEWALSVLWRYYVNILKYMGIVRRRVKPRPTDRISSFNFPRLKKWESSLALTVGTGYNALFLAAWNFHFPSKIELLLWRVTTSLIVGGGVIGGVFEILNLKAGQRKTTPEAAPTFVDKEAGDFPGPVLSRSWWRKNGSLRTILRNNSPDKDPALDVPLRSLLFTTPLCVIYVFCRSYILLEDIIGFRELEVTAYRTVEWSDYWPHF